MLKWWVNFEYMTVRHRGSKPIEVTSVLLRLQISSPVVKFSTSLKKSRSKTKFTIRRWPITTSPVIAPIAMQQWWRWYSFYVFIILRFYSSQTISAHVKFVNYKFNNAGNFRICFNVKLSVRSINNHKIIHQ